MHNGKPSCQYCGRDMLLLLYSYICEVCTKPVKHVVISPEKPRRDEETTKKTFREDGKLQDLWQSHIGSESETDVVTHYLYYLHSDNIECDCLSCNKIYECAKWQSNT